MIGPSKILTVSYGTFSCTLEGFDDPFNTMRAIAEYFRDLAAGDRYFGAEPPIPDAAMLHKIAEREIHRRVEAKIQENGVILRTGNAMSPAAQIAAPAVAVAAAPAPDMAPQPAAPSVAPAAPAGIETAAQRLSRLRAAQIVEPARVVAPPQAAVLVETAVAGPAIAEIAAYAEDQDVDAVAAPAFEAEIAAPAAEADQPEESLAEEDLADLRALDGIGEVAPDRVEADGADPMAVVAEVIEDLDQAAPDLAADADADADAEPVETLIALVDQNVAGHDAPAADPELPPNLTEAADQSGADAPQAADWLDSESLSGEVIEDADQNFGFDSPGMDDLGGFDLAADVPDAEIAEVEADDRTDTILASLASLTQRTEAPTAPLVDLDDDGSDLSSALNDSIAASLAEAAVVEPLDPDDKLEPLAAAGTVDDAPLTEAPLAQPAETVVLEEAPTAPAPQVGEKLQRARARVIKIRRADAPALVIGRAPAPAVAPPIDAVALAPTQVDGLSPEAEAALQRELTALQPDAEPELDAGAEAALKAALDSDLALEPAAPSTAVAEPQPTAVAGVDAVDRLMAETNSHLEVPETKRRQSAIAHLKAAVAATIADRLTDPRAAAKKAEARLNPYRKDLEQAVGPARPAEVMGADRPAPLVLVSSQRIDRPKPAVPAAVPPAPRVVQPVRPRRVTSTGPAMRSVSLVGDDEVDEIAEDASTRAENIFSAGAAQSFPEFAERLGVSTMPDMLEAAAAYCALVLGREQFSRPLLLETVARLPGAEDTSLEDSLRGFGTLLRDGRITKVRRGQFQLSEDSHVLTEAKRFVG